MKHSPVAISSQLRIPFLGTGSLGGWRSGAVTSWKLQMRSPSLSVTCETERMNPYSSSRPHGTTLYSRSPGGTAMHLAGEHMGSHLTPLELTPWQGLMQPGMLDCLLGM